MVELQADRTSLTPCICKGRWLSQLSYSPTYKKVVGLSGLEPLDLTLIRRAL